MNFFLIRQDSFTSLFGSFQNGYCDYFYFHTTKFSVLFQRENQISRAIINRSTKSLQTTLKTEGKILRKKKKIEDFFLKNILF